MAFFSQLLLLEVPRVSASISPTDKRTETRQPPLERVRFFLSCHINNSISRFAAIRLVFQYWVTFVAPTNIANILVISCCFFESLGYKAGLMVFRIEVCLIESVVFLTSVSTSELLSFSKYACYAS